MSRQTRVNGGRSRVSLKEASALIVKVNGNSHKRCSTQRRPGQHLRAALQVPRVRLPAGDEQRGLALDAAVRHSGARSDRVRAVACAARPRRALSQLLTRHTTTCRAGTFAVSSWSRQTVDHMKIKTNTTLCCQRCIAHQKKFGVWHTFGFQEDAKWPSTWIGLKVMRACGCQRTFQHMVPAW